MDKLTLITGILGIIFLIISIVIIVPAIINLIRKKSLLKILLHHF